jgi:hypothetical protein
MRPGMQLLLDLLRGRLRKREFSHSDFASLLEVAEEENVTPWAVDRLRRVDADFAPEQSQRLDELYRTVQFSSFVWAEILKNTLQAFHRADVAVIALKGPSLAERLYGDAAMRSCSDLDLLVRGKDVLSAERVLEEIGFSPNGRGDDYHRAWSRKAMNLELHHNVENPLAFDFDVDAAWGRAAASQFQGAPLWLMSGGDELLYLCLHAVRHRFDRLSLLLDLTLAFRRLSGSGAESRKGSNPVFANILELGWMMAARLDPDLPTLQTMRVWTGDRQRLERLADRLWEQLMKAPQPALDWATQHRFYLEVESPGWRRLGVRLRHQRILATRLIDEDFVFAGRFHLHRDWQVRLLRPIRLLVKGRRPSSESA